MDGMIIKVDLTLIYCFVDSDIAGLRNYEDQQDISSMTSRMGFVIILVCTSIWVLNYIEAEYIELSTVM